MDIETKTKREKILEILLNEAKQYKDHNDGIYEVLNILLPKVIPQILAFDLIDVQWSPMKDYMCKVIVSRKKHNGEFDFRDYYSDRPVFERTVFEEDILLSTYKLATKCEYKDYNSIFTALDNVAAEIAAEINSWLILILDNAMQETEGTEYFHKHSYAPPTSTWCGGGHVRLPILINRQCNLIAARTRRGAGNWCMVPHVGMKILEQEQSYKRSNEPTNYGKSIVKIGQLNEKIDIYVNKNWSSDHEILIGYGGDANGFIYVPYRPIIPNVGIIDPMTFESYVGFRTQFALAKMNEMNARDYLGKIKIVYPK